MLNKYFLGHFIITSYIALFKGVIIERKEFYLLAVGYLKLVFVFLRGQLHIIEFRKYPKSALIEQKNGKKVRLRETALLS